MLRSSCSLIILALSTSHFAFAEGNTATDVKAEAPAAKAASLPARVDLRPQMKEWGLTPRHQGRRNTCSVFTTAAVLEFAASKHFNEGQRFSVEYLNWACNQVINNHTQDRGQFFGDLLKAFDEHGICLEKDLAYSRRFDDSVEPSADVIKSADEFRKLGLKVHWIKPWYKNVGLTDRRMDEVKTILAKGYPVAAGASHSRLIVGYEDDADQPGGGIFYTQDSGIGKFSSVTYKFAKENMNDLFWVEAPQAKL